MAALIVRAMPGWADETGLPTFTDNTADTELMTRVATVQRHDVVRGYQDDVCREQGKPPPCYGPLDTVKYGQVHALHRPRDGREGLLGPASRTTAPSSPTRTGRAGPTRTPTGRRCDHRMVVTYVHYAGAPPDVADAHAPFTVATASGVKGWGDAAPRAWFARAFWPALDAYFGTTRLPLILGGRATIVAHPTGRAEIRHAPRARSAVVLVRCAQRSNTSNSADRVREVGRPGPPEFVCGAGPVGHADRRDAVGPRADDVVLAVADHDDAPRRDIGAAIEGQAHEGRLVGVREVHFQA